MASSETFTGLASEADCLFLCQNISGTGESESIGTTLSEEFYPEEGVPTGGVLAVTCFGLKINELPSCIAKDIFKALFVNDLAICFRGRSLDTIERHLQQAVNAIQEWATRNGFRFAAHKCKVIHFTAPWSQAQRPPLWGLETHFCQWSPQSSLGCGGLWNGEGTETLLMLYSTIVRPKFDYGCIVYGTASNTNLRQLDSIHNSGLRLALGAFCTSPVSSLYTDANEAPLEERRLKLSMHYFVKTRACIDNPAHHALHEFVRTTRFICSQNFWTMKKQLESQQEPDPYDTITEEGTKLTNPEEAKEYIAQYYEQLYQAREGTIEYQE